MVYELISNRTKFLVGHQHIIRPGGTQSERLGMQVLSIGTGCLERIGCRFPEMNWAKGATQMSHNVA